MSVSYFGIKVSSAIIGSIISKSARDQGLQFGDRIIRINHHNVESWEQINYYIDTREYALCDIVRKEHDVWNYYQLNLSMLIDGFIGIEKATSVNSSKSIIYKFKDAFYYITDQVEVIFNTLQSLFKNYTQNYLSTYANIATISKNAVESGLYCFLRFLVVMNIMLGTINMIPLPIFDGGRLFSALIYSTLNKFLPDDISLKLVFILQFSFIIFLWCFLLIIWFFD